MDVITQFRRVRLILRYSRQIVNYFTIPSVISPDNVIHNTDRLVLYLRSSWGLCCSWSPLNISPPSYSPTTYLIMVLFYISHLSANDLTDCHKNNLRPVQLVYSSHPLSVTALNHSKNVVDLIRPVFVPGSYSESVLLPSLLGQMSNQFLSQKRRRFVGK